MCGITGYISTNHLDQNVIDKMVSIINHRGPDDFGTKIVTNKNYQLALGHKRLSILDISTDGHQPMNYKNLWIIYNGEIYNFKDIRQELIKLGHTFNSQSDTEVILHAFDEWNTKAVNKFIGMFAFVIYNETDENLLIFRDRIGVKPLYYYTDNDTFMFASELKSLHQNPLFKKEINTNNLAQFFKYGFIHAPNSIFKNVYKLEQGHYLKYNLKSLTFTTHQYWNALDFYKKPKLNISYKEAKLKLETLMKDAFKLRMVSDVPVGVFLSGGYDSSTVAAILQKELDSKIKTFTIAFNDKEYDESKYAEEVAKILKTEHYTFACTDKEALDIIPELPFYYDEPFADFSSIPTILLSKKTKEKVTVSLSADGGDELFFGYHRHQKVYKYYHKLKKLGFLNTILAVFKNNYFKQNLYQQNGTIQLLDTILMRNKDSFIKKIFKKPILLPKTNFQSNDYSTIDKFHRILAVDFTTYLPDDILVKVDRATMSTSLEGREPMLDHRIIEYVAQLPFEFLYDNKTKSQKHILRDICHQYLPKELMNRKKTGFTPPLKSWLRNELKELTINTLSKSELEKHGLFNVNFIQKGLKSFLNGNDNYLDLIWNTIIFQLWYKKWMLNE